MNELKDRIRKERLKKGMNQPELAKILNVSKQTVSNWENGNRTPDTVTLSKLADLFGVTTDYLLGKEDNLVTTKYPASENKDFDKVKESRSLREDFIELLKKSSKVKDPNNPSLEEIMEFFNDIYKKE